MQQPSSRPGGRRIPPVVYWRNAIRDSSTLPSAARLIGFVLSTYFRSDRLEATVSRETLSRCTGLSLRTIDEHVPKLERAELLQVRRTRGGALCPNTYFGHLPPTAQVVDLTERRMRSNGAAGSENGVPAAQEVEDQKDQQARVPLDECWGCKQVRPIVDPDFLYCAECLQALDGE